MEWLFVNDLRIIWCPNSSILLIDVPIEKRKIYDEKFPSLFDIDSANLRRFKLSRAELVSEHNYWTIVKEGYRLPTVLVCSELDIYHIIICSMETNERIGWETDAIDSTTRKASVISCKRKLFIVSPANWPFVRWIQNGVSQPNWLFACETLLQFSVKIKRLHRIETRNKYFLCRPYPNHL